MLATNSPLRTVEIVLGGVPVTELAVNGAYWDFTLQAGKRVGKNVVPILATTNGTAPVTIIPAPAVNHEFELASFYLVQINVADTTVSLKYNDNGTRSLATQETLSQGDQMRYT